MDYGGKGEIQNKDKYWKLKQFFSYTGYVALKDGINCELRIVNTSVGKEKFVAYSKGIIPPCQETDRKERKKNTEEIIWCRLNELIKVPHMQ
jgi:hypothetical protein